MARLIPDQSFYPSPGMAMAAEPEKLAYVALLNPDPQKSDALAVVDLDPTSPGYGQLIDRVNMPGTGDELHHFGWNACSSCLCPNAPHPHVERRYLVVPGLRSSRIHVLDTKPDPAKPAIVKVIEPAEVAERAGYTRPHTIHCGPEGIYVAALGNAEGKRPGGVFLMDQESFDVRGRWEIDRGEQELAYDAWWHLGHDTLVTSEWGTPDTFEEGLVPEILLGAKYGRRLHFWDLHTRKHQQTIDFGDKYQLVFELRPAELAADGLVATLRKHIDVVRRVRHARIELRVKGERRLPAASESELFRIAQEALNNALKHARAESIEISLDLASGRARLAVRDDGVGFDPKSPAVRSKRLGLTSMRERTEGLGGSFSVESRPGGGTTIRAEVPLG